MNIFYRTFSALVMRSYKCSAPQRIKAVHVGLTLLRSNEFVAVFPTAQWRRSSNERNFHLDNDEDYNELEIIYLWSNLHLSELMLFLNCMLSRPNHVKLKMLRNFCVEKTCSKECSILCTECTMQYWKRFRMKLVLPWHLGKYVSRWRHSFSSLFRLNSMFSFLRAVSKCESRKCQNFADSVR